MNDEKTLSQLMQNPEFMEKLKTATGIGDVQAAFADECIDLTEDEVMELLKGIQSIAIENGALENGALSEEDLENVSGGFVDWVLAFSIGVPLGIEAGKALDSLLKSLKKKKKK